MINHHKVWDQARIELANPGFAVRLTSVARHVTDCATRPSKLPLSVMAVSIKYCDWKLTL